jgi:hypothetical protein
MMPAMRRLTTNSGPLIIFSSQRLLDSGEMRRMSEQTPGRLPHERR